MASFIEEVSQRAKQIASVYLMYFIVLTGSTFTLGLFITPFVLFLPLLWPLAFSYLIWTYCVDWNTFKRGGRRLGTGRMAFFRYIRDYYPISLTKTAELDAENHYIFGYHPHGMIPEGLLVAFGTEELGFSEKFPGVVPHIGGHSSE